MESAFAAEDDDEEDDEEAAVVAVWLSVTSRSKGEATGKGAN